MKLFIDDIRVPEDIYPFENDWHLCRTITEAVRLLATQSCRQISLDHDISHSILVNGIYQPYACDETYESVAWYIDTMLNVHTAVSECSSPIKKITLHSASPIGRKKMREILSVNCNHFGIELNELPGCAAAHVE